VALVKGIKRRRLASIGAAPLALGAWPSRAQRADLPKECRIFIGFTAGGGVDLMGRAIATQLGMRTSMRISVDNRAGRWGAIPGELLKTNPVGSTLAFLPSTTLADSLLAKDFPFDPQKDIAPLIVAANFPVALAVSPRLGIRSFDEYIQFVKSGDADARRIGNTNVDAILAVINRTMREALGANLVPVDYGGAVPLLNDLERGAIPAGLSNIAAFLPAHRGGRVRLILTSGTERLAVPGIPNAVGLDLPELNIEEWVGFFISPETEPALQEEWNDRLASALTDSLLIDDLRGLGVHVTATTIEETKSRLRLYLTSWRQRLDDLGLAPGDKPR
jgi:tripartite-type tricarboxylate transporter receptor subunit TctC